MYAATIDHLADCTLLDLGGGAGATDDLADPLLTFKRGFANATATTWLCGAILDAAAYAGLAAGHDGSFFPAGRSPARMSAVPFCFSQATGPSLSGWSAATSCQNAGL